LLFLVASWHVDRAWLRLLVHTSRGPCRSGPKGGILPWSRIADRSPSGTTTVLRFCIMPSSTILHRTIFYFVFYDSHHTIFYNFASSTNSHRAIFYNFTLQSRPFRLHVGSIVLVHSASLNWFVSCLSVGMRRVYGWSVSHLSLVCVASIIGKCYISWFLHVVSIVSYVSCLSLVCVSDLCLLLSPTSLLAPPCRVRGMTGLDPTPQIGFSNGKLPHLH
jgi:hypothetical protein